MDDWQQLADNLKQERDNYADTVKYWEKMVAELQLEKDAMAEKLRRHTEGQREREVDRDTYRREKEMGDNKLKELAQTIANLTNDREMVHRELLREREKLNRKERDIAAIHEKGINPLPHPPQIYFKSIK